MENRLTSSSYGAPTTPTASISAGHGSASFAGGPTQTVGTPSSGSLANAQHMSIGVPALPPTTRRAPLHVANVETGRPAKRTRKERGPNWQAREINALIAAKRKLFLEELETADGHELMQSDTGKWKRISGEVMKAGSSPCLRDEAACKSKWHLIIQDYKKIADYLARTGTNEATYWSMTTAARKAEDLPRSFPQDVYFSIQDWYGRRPAMRPPHSRDLMSGKDKNYETPATGTSSIPEESGSDQDPEDPFTVVSSMEESGENTDSTQSPVLQVGGAKVSAVFGLRSPGRTASLSTTAKGSLPPGVFPQVLSSSDTADASPRRAPGSTRVRGKSLSGHSLIAQATQATGDAMTGQMKQIAEASQELERSKIDVQLKHSQSRWSTNASVTVASMRMQDW